MTYLSFGLTWQVPHVEQELLSFPEHFSSLLVFNGVCVTLSLVFCVVFCKPLFALFLLYYLSFQLWLLITPLVSSKFILCNTCFQWLLFSQICMWHAMIKGILIYFDFRTFHGTKERKRNLWWNNASFASIKSTIVAGNSSNTIVLYFNSQ